MHDPMKHSDHLISIVSQLRRISRDGTLQLDEESFAGLLQDLGSAFRSSLQMEKDLHDLRYMRNLLTDIAKRGEPVWGAAECRAMFSVVGGTQAQTPKTKKDTGNAC